MLVGVTVIAHIASLSQKLDVFKLDIQIAVGTVGGKHTKLNRVYRLSDVSPTASCYMLYYPAFKP